MLYSPFEELALDRLIGKGALGTVRVGRWRSCDVAVKLVEGISEEESKLLLNEVNVLRKASHPGVVRLLGVCVEPMRMALVLEYLPGGDLAKAISSGKFGPEHLEACLIAYLLLFALFLCFLCLTVSTGGTASVSADRVRVCVLASSQRSH